MLENTEILMLNYVIVSHENFKNIKHIHTHKHTHQHTHTHYTDKVHFYANKMSV